MAIKATIATHREGNTWVVQVAGWLSQDSARTLREALAGKEGPIRMDITGLRFAEQSTLGNLRRLEGAGAEIVGASPYIERLLRSVSSQESGVPGETRGSLTASGGA
jgi:hypothetical protein